MKEILLDTIMDSLKLLPFLFVAFLIIELLEHKINNQKIVAKSKKIGPLIGSLLGAVPQCGFSASITNLYATRIVTLGTLIAVYLSTSDEMLPIMLSENVEFSKILSIILLKVIIGMIAGFIIDFFLRKKEEVDIKDMCEHEHCHCEKGIFVSALKHTISILAFIFVITLLLNMGFEYLGEDNIQKLFMKDSLLSPFIASLIGLIPNCGASVVVTELYLNNAITFGSCMAGLLTGSGIGILILFRINKNLKENLRILGLIYGIGAISGLIIEIFMRV